MNVLQKIEESALVPVVVLENVQDAVPTANALLAGGISVMEITFRTEAAADSIKEVSEQCPDILVGAGTVITIEQCRRAVSYGAKFIVSPGYDEEVVSWCCKNSIPVVPGCATPSEIMAALKHDLSVLKFFPANVYGGLSAMKALHGPFGNVKFIPTGGVNLDNIGEFIEAPFIHAVGGSWICPKDAIVSQDFEKITSLCEQARLAILGYEIAHVGINSSDSVAAENVCEKFAKAFGFETKLGNSSNFSSSSIEIMNSNYLGAHGHLAVKTRKIDLAILDLEKKGFEIDMSTAKFKGDKMIAVYLKSEFGGFAVHLLQK
jgi:2-dehydro-3-deoxyphosphogluconate aldolase/(4S)-4-hydroxy-2-oxoglutarate aldolase